MENQNQERTQYFSDLVNLPLGLIETEVIYHDKNNYLLCKDFDYYFVTCDLPISYTLVKEDKWILSPKVYSFIGINDNKPVYYFSVTVIEEETLIDVYQIFDIVPLIQDSN